MGLPSTVGQTGCPVAALNKNATGISDGQLWQSGQQWQCPPPHAFTPHPIAPRYPRADFQTHCAISLGSPVERMV
jgi:hypothetical protein